MQLQTSAFHITSISTVSLNTLNVNTANVNTNKSSTSAGKQPSPQKGFILITTLVFLLILGVVSGALFTQIVATQQQANLSIRHIHQLNTQRNLFNRAKQHAQQLIIQGHDLTQRTTGYTPAALQAQHDISQWIQIQSNHWQHQDEISYRLVYMGMVTNSQAQIVHWFTVEQSHPYWQSTSLPAYSVSVVTPSI
ncbi:type II secretion system protein [Thalassotalea litorea]|uniref:Type II secretion system protein n=1 Tax=Thalassotalea litorea TaxID=2020715 RepID=A0A5R9IFX2_9GAMM|nr:type II secretion system protein [Thalassotalea litorea]TLU61454.1 type II secretion system protein [Thalassotalea litorea]